MTDKLYESQILFLQTSKNETPNSTIYFINENVSLKDNKPWKTREL